jgi:hypothetical protein
MDRPTDDNPRPADDPDIGLLSPLFADGRPFLTLGSLALLFSGGFAIFLGLAGQFLPHDIQYLGMTARELCAQNACRIVHFMIHDRVSFGGTLIALAVLYLWLIHFPLRARRPWAWWTLLLSNVAGFASFLTYLGFGYLDTWHGLATLLLLPCFALGLALSYRTLAHPRGIASVLQSSLVAFATPGSERQRRPGWPQIGRYLMLATGATMFAAGVTITLVGVTVVFVPQDLQYMDTTTARLDALNPRLIPLIAHDRAGFGGGVLNVGLLIVACTWCAAPSRHHWQALAVAGTIGFVTAIGIHPLVGYNNPVHLAPACLGALSYVIALALTYPRGIGAHASNAHGTCSVGFSPPLE